MHQWVSIRYRCANIAPLMTPDPFSACSAHTRWTCAVIGKSMVIDWLQVVPVSQAQARQRAGRAGGLDSLHWVLCTLFGLYMRGRYHCKS